MLLPMLIVLSSLVCPVLCCGVLYVVGFVRCVFYGFVLLVYFVVCCRVMLLSSVVILYCCFILMCTFGVSFCCFTSLRYVVGFVCCVLW